MMLRTQWDPFQDLRSTQEERTQDQDGNVSCGPRAGPPTLRSAVPDWHAGNTMPLGRDKSPRVVEVRSASDPDEDPVQVVKSA
jgi:hypothetical protein